MDGSDNKYYQRNIKGRQNKKLSYICTFENAVIQYLAFAFKACLSVHIFPQNRNEQK